MTCVLPTVRGERWQTRGTVRSSVLWAVRPAVTCEGAEGRAHREGVGHLVALAAGERGLAHRVRPVRPHLSQGRRIGESRVVDATREGSRIGGWIGVVAAST